MPTHVNHNLYPGVNAHLNSVLQEPYGRWPGFHSTHINTVRDYLDARLPDAYYASVEGSLQIRTDDDPAPSNTRADVLTWRNDTATQSQPRASATDPTMTLELQTAIPDTLNPLMSVVIRQARDDTPITRIEVLSPGNKPPGAHYAVYRAKRSEALLSGLRCVEIDYLHEHAPTIEHIPSYADQQDGAYPYYIISMNPDAQPANAQVQVYGVGVLQALPTVAVPLAGDDVIAVDFGMVYKQASEKRAFLRLVDYAQEPVNFAAYTPADQQAIRAFMAQVATGQPPE